MKYLKLILTICLSFSYLYSQAPEQDCFGAISVCAQNYSQPNSYTGQGTSGTEINAGISCLGSGEKNGVWYVFNVSTTGNLGFLITPNDPSDDYDWAVFNLTNASCADIATNANLQVSCNYSGDPGPTGADGSTALNNQNAAGTPFNAFIPVNAGETYVLYVSNFSSSQSGYDLSFNVVGNPSPATILDNVAPALITNNFDPTININCQRTQITIEFSEFVDCPSVEAQDFTVNGIGGPYTVTAVAGAPCTGGRGNTYILTVSPAMTTAGAYLLSYAGGASDLCGNIAQPASINFNLSGASDADLVVDSLNCSQNKIYVHLNKKIQCPSLIPTEFSINGPGAPYTFTSVTPIGCMNNLTTTLELTIDPPITISGSYVLFPTGTALDSCGLVLNPDTANFNVQALPLVSILGNNVLCRGDSTILVATGADSYVWMPGNIQNDTLIVKTLVSTSYTVTPTFGFCQGSPITIPVTVKPDPIAQFDMVSSVCKGDTVDISLTHGADVNSIYTWNFGGAIILSGSGAGPYQVYWPTSGVKSVSIHVNRLGCEKDSVATILINDLPVVEAGSLQVICEGDLGVTLSASLLSSNLGCSYQWTPSTGLANPTSLTTSAFPDTTTTYYFQAVCGSCISNIDSVTVIVNPKPNVSTPKTVYTYCLGSNGVQLNPSVNNTISANPNFQWTPAFGLSNPFILNPIASPDVNTLYSLVVTDSSGCQSDTLKLLVEVDSIPYANAGSDLYICKNSGQGVFLNGQGFGSGNNTSYTYLWIPSTGLSNPNIANPYALPDTTTIYTLVVTSGSGCSSQITTLDTLSTLTVHIVEPAIAHAGPDTTVCLGQQVQIGEVPEGQGPMYQYVWQPSTGLNDSTSATPLASPNFTTMYKLTVFSNGCLSSEDSVLVTVPVHPTAFAGNNVQVCVRDSVQLNGSGGGVSGPFTYRWEPTTGLSDPFIANPMASPSDTTWYKLYVSYMGCEGTPDSVMVQVKPRAIADADTTNQVDGFKICYGETLVLPSKITSINQPVTHVWYPLTGIINPSSVTPTVRPLESITYYLTATVGGCSTIDSVRVFVHPDINPQITADTTIICQRDIATLTASGGVGSATFEWFPATGLNTNLGATVLASPDTTTTYTVVVREGLCVDSTKITVQVLSRPKPKFGYSYADGCQGLTVTFQDSTFATSYVWEFGDGEISNVPNPVHTYQQAGMFFVKLTTTGEGGCIDTTEYRIFVKVGPSLEGTFYSIPDEQKEIYLPYATIEFYDSTKNALTWLWDFGNGQTSVEQNPVQTYHLEGNYLVTLTVTDIKGCSYVIQKGPYQIFEPTYIIPNVFTPNEDGINDTWKVKYLGKERVSFQIFDRWGNLMFTSESVEQGWNGNVKSGKQALDGVYFYQVKIGNKFYEGNLTLVR